MLTFQKYYNLNESSFREQMLMQRKEKEQDKTNPVYEFETERGSIYKLGKTGTIYRQKYTGSNFESDAISFVDEPIYKEIISLPNKHPDVVIMVKHRDKKLQFHVNDELIAEFPSTPTPKVGLYPVDSKNGYIHVGHKITTIK